METLLYFVLANLLVYGDIYDDPAAQGFFGRQQARQLDCERLSQAKAHERYPGEVPPPHTRSSALMQIDALVCQHRVVADDMREPRDEVILQKLEEDVAELTGLAALETGPETRWVVDAYYPNPAIIRKIAGASRVALAERGLWVTDQPPRLSAGDVEVLRTLPMRDALPVACRRLFSSRALEGGPLGDDVAFLSLALLHPSESQLHAGLCRRGQFRWIR